MAAKEKKKPVRDLTNDEIARRLFPKEVIDKVKADSKSKNTKQPQPLKP